MKKTIKFKSLLLALCLLTGIDGYAQEVSKVVNVETAGNLVYYIHDTEKYQVTSLTVTGNLNSKDIRLIREMGGRDLKGNATEGKLTVLDLSGAKIAASQEFYYENEAYGYRTTENKMGGYMFFECNLVSVTIPTSINTIDKYAFGNCMNITSISIPKNVTTIESSAFGGSTNLKAFSVSEENPNYSSFEGVLYNKDKSALVIYPNAKSANYTIPDNVTKIGDWAFANCADLISVTINNNVLSIGEAAFGGCKKLKTISAPEQNPNYTSLDGVLFNKDKTMLIAYPFAKSSNYSIPDGVTKIGEWAFGGCSDLITVTIPTSVTNIGENAFMGCNGLSTVTIPTSVTNIGGYAFRACSGLISINIPNSITSIGEAVFYDCSRLTDVTIPTSVTTIGYYAFGYCTSLASITIPNSVTDIESYAFSGCSSLTSINISNKVTSIAKYTFFGCSSLGSITIPNKVTNIDEGAFALCNNLFTINIPASVANIGEFAFYETGWYRKQEDGVIYANRVLYYHKGMPKKTSIVIKEGTVSISDGAFQGCDNLVTVTIPEGMTTIGERAFRDCNSLTSITIPSSVTSIGKQAFYGIINAKKINSLNTIPPVCGESCFLPADAPLYVPIGSKSAYQAAEIWKDFNNISEKTFTSIVEPDKDEAKIYTLPGKIIIENMSEGQIVSINSLGGQPAYRGTDKEITLESGVYIVKVGNITQKVMIK